ncbi:hypothetical protein [Acidocella aminolytica]|uniref:Clostridial hydrophobic W n=1 Tax=Acidocella aminolytica 101 = DSM 11237 TaxID=1120923 RepID=A0A0D6PEK3_9PROT|nr:hypothetical protein [Acidocella aminolytica]GAN79294.1 hypothetical protein Aam_020_058 [Acidocella aminolytica 101 = DSM 11237]GBQ39615.1 hypothetical protein AA11237_2124 [Acidocella aminolytica 101 = DSM 11237]SHE37729.1 hydrophobic W protein [Acidocella aminolytica 101 = DSM 11237]
MKVTGHLMALPPGLFCFVNEMNHNAALHNGLPGVRVSPPPIGGQNVEISGFRSDGWLNAEGDAVLVRIKNQPSQVLVTIYQLANLPDASPKLQVRQLLGEPNIAANSGPTTKNDTSNPSSAKNANIVAHIQTRGDVGGAFGEWIGEKGSKNWIEGFTVTSPEGIAAEDLTYQAVLGRGWLSPWVEAGQYCGSRGMALPLLGLRIRLSGAAAEKYDISYSASFVGGASSGPVSNDETCEAETLAPLEAFQVTLTPRGRKTGKSRK